MYHNHTLQTSSRHHDEDPHGAVSWNAMCDCGISSDCGIFLMVP